MSTVREKIITALTLFWDKAQSLLIRKANIVDNCASTSTEYPLSANQGTQLQTQIDELNSNLSNNNLGTGVDLLPYKDGKWYTIPSDGYIYILLTYVANQYIYAEIGGMNSNAFPIQISTGGSGNNGNISIPVFVRKGMYFEITGYSDLSNAQAYFYAIS